MMKIIQPLVRLWKKIELVGISPRVSYFENRQIKKINIITSICTVLAFSYAVLNSLTGSYIVAAVDFTGFLATVLVFYLTYRGRHIFAKNLLLLTTFLLLSTANIFSLNSSEYYLLCVLVVSIYFFQKPWFQVTIAFLIFGSIIIPKFFPELLAFTQPVSKQRLIINTTISLTILLFISRYFQHIQHEYHKKIETQHNNLLVLNRDMEYLFTIIAHDIRGPLSATARTIESIVTDQLPEQQKHYALNLVQKQLETLHNNIEILLNWSSRNLKGMTTNPVSIPVQALLEEVLCLVKPLYQEKQLVLSVEIPPSLRLVSDIDHLRIILRNLISNAIKFSFTAGKIYIRVAEDRGMGIVSITDTGVGITSEKMKLLFSSLQEPSYGTIGERGYGLGLILSYELVKLNAGHLTISSKEKEGSTFAVHLPLPTDLGSDRTAKS